MQNINFVPKGVQRTLSSHKNSEKYNELEVFYKKAVFKNLAIFIGKQLCWRLLFNKNAGLQACNFIKKKLQHMYFPKNIVKILRTSIL